MVFWLSRYQGSATGSRLQSSILARYFAFSVISELIIFTLIGATFSTCCIIHSSVRLLTLILGTDTVADIIKDIEHDKGLRDAWINIDGMIG